MTVLEIGKNIKNSIKFFPWQLGQIPTIHGVYTNFDFLAIVGSIASMTLGLVLLLMAFLRQDKGSWEISLLILRFKYKKKEF